MCYATVLILLAKGWSIYRISISTAAQHKLIAFNAVYGTVSVSVLVWEHGVYDEAR